MAAQTGEATELAKELIQASDQYGFAALAFMVLLLLGSAGITIYFLKVVIPERDARIKTQNSMAECMKILGEQDIKQTILFEQQLQWNERFEDQLLELKEFVGKAHQETKQIVQNVPCKKA